MIASVLSAHIAEINNSVPKENSQKISFIKANEHQIGSYHKKLQQPSLLDKANEHQIGSNYVFPSDIYCTGERPGIVIWSPGEKKIVIVELTCPAKESIENAKICKAT